MNNHNLFHESTVYNLILWFVDVKWKNERNRSDWQKYIYFFQSRSVAESVKDPKVSYSWKISWWFTDEINAKLVLFEWNSVT